MDKLKDDMRQSDDLDDRKKLELEQLMNRMEATISQDDMWRQSSNHIDPATDSIEVSANNQAADLEDTANSAYDSFRKPLVGIAGSTLVATGVVLIPLPVVPGSLVVYAGLSLLATEFDGAKEALNAIREKFLVDEEEVESRQVESSGTEEDLISWTDLLPSYYPLNTHLWSVNDIDEEFMAMLHLKRHVHALHQEIIEHEREAARKTRVKNNEMRRWVRKLLNLERGGCTAEDVDSTLCQATPAHEDSLSCQTTQKPSLLVRFDSMLSSYGEEVGQDMVVVSDQTDCTIANLSSHRGRTLASRMYSSSSSIGLNSRHDSDAGIFYDCSAFDDTCVDLTSAQLGMLSSINGY